MHLYTPANKFSTGHMAGAVLLGVVSGVLAGAALGWLSWLAAHQFATSASRMPRSIIVGLMSLSGFAVYQFIALVIRVAKVRASTLAFTGSFTFLAATVLAAVVTYQQLGSRVPGWVLLGAGCFSMAIGALFAPLRARRPFCEHCGQWFTQEHPLQEYPFSVREHLIALLQAAEISGAEKLISPTYTQCTIELAATACACPRDNGMLLINVVARGKNTAPQTQPQRFLMASIAATDEEIARLRVQLADGMGQTDAVSQ